MLKTNILQLDNEKYRLDEAYLEETLSNTGSYSLFDSKKYTILPGFCDVHVHLREPGFFYKESIKTGTMSALKGGYTAVMSMPNLNPVPDSKENLKVQEDIIRKSALVKVYPYGSLTVKELGKEISDLEEMNVLAYSDDGRGVQSEEVMRDAMKRVKALDKVLAAHCEDNSLLEGGYIHKGEYAKKYGHRGICSESEYKQIERDLKLAKETKVKYHVCHISTKESVDLIRRAKKEGVDVTCETGPHYLLLSDKDLKEEGRFKMNPPLRSEEDKEALIEGILDGTIDMIATDHAPHSQEEKSKGLEKSAFGIVGLETAFSLIYTNFVKTGIMTMDRLMKLLVINPRERFKIPFNNKEFSIWNLDEEYIIEPNNFKSKGRATPFEGEKVFAKHYKTFL